MIKKILDWLWRVGNCDNQSALYIAENPVFYERIKHIKVDSNFIGDKVLAGLLQLTYLPTKHQLADIFIKSILSLQLQMLTSKFGLIGFLLTTLPNLRRDINIISPTLLNK